MRIDKDSIKKWLKSQKKDRNWLATKCLVTKSAIDKWFNREGIIPSAKLELIKSLMEEDAPEKSGKISYPILNGVASVPVLLDPEQLEVITWAANDLGMSVDEFIREAAIKDSSTYSQENAKKNPTGEKSVGNEERRDVYPGLPPERRYLRAARHDDSETA